MCLPVAALALVGTAVSAIGSGVGAIQQAQTHRYQAAIADRNARLSAESAHAQKEATQQEMLAHYRQVSQLQGQQRAAMAAGGIDINFGSAADVQGDTAMLGREDAGRILDRGERAVRGFDIEASNYSAQAGASRQAASGALVSGAFGVANTALSGAKQYKILKSKFG